MKNFKLLLLLFLLPTLMLSQKLESIKGSKKVTVEQRKLENFDSLEVGNNFEILLVKGDSNSIEIEADDNLHEIIDATINGTTLNLTTKKKISSFGKLLVRVVYTSNFKSVISRNEAMITALIEMDLEQMTFKSFDESKLFLNAKVKNFSIIANDKSKIELNLKSENAVVELSKNSFAKALINTTKLKFDLYQKTKAVIEGECADMKLRLSNFSEFEGLKFDVKNIDLTIESNSKCEVNALTTMSIDAADHSEIQLYGTPKIEMKKFTGSAILYKKEETPKKKL